MISKCSSDIIDLICSIVSESNCKKCLKGTVSSLGVARVIDGGMGLKQTQWKLLTVEVGSLTFNNLILIR